MISGDIRNIKSSQVNKGITAGKKVVDTSECPRDSFAHNGDRLQTNEVIMPPDLRKININKTLVSFAESLEAKPHEGQEKEWTVMFYMDGANDLEPHIANAMLDLERVGSNDKINLVSQVARLSQDELKKLLEIKYKESQNPKDLEALNHNTNIDGDWQGVRRYYVVNNKDTGSRHPYYTSEMKENLYLTDISHPQTLANFVSWGIKNYPAKHYMLVVMDHGSGWLGAITNEFSGSNGQMMSTPSIAEALKSAEKTTNRKLDIVHFATCLMGSSEVAYQLRDTADYMIASEELGTTKALNYGSIIEKLNTSIRSGDTTPRDLSRMIVNHFIKDNPDAFKTHSAVDLDKMGEVKDKLEEVVSALNNTTTPMEILKQIVENVQSYGKMASYHPFTDYRDLRELAIAIQNNPEIKDETLKEAAYKLSLAVDQAVVIKTPPTQYRTETVEKIEKVGKTRKTHIVINEEEISGGGLSIYLPLKEGNTYRKFKEDYTQLDLAKDTQWDEFLEKITHIPDYDKEIRSQSESPQPL